MLNTLKNYAYVLYDVVIPGPGGGSGGPDISNGSQYVIWDPEMIKAGLTQMTDYVKVAFNVGIWVFLILSGIYLIVTIVRSLFG